MYKYAKRLCGFLLCMNFIFAHPTTYKSGKVLWYIKNNSIQDLRLGYSIKHNWLIGARHIKNLNTSNFMFNSNWLLKRWNEIGSQANLYLLSNLDIKNKLHFGIQGDWENRRWYVASMIDYYNNKNSYEMRLGYSPYLIDFEGLSSWIILQNMNGELRPIIRFFKNQYLVEIRLNENFNSYITFMIHF